MSRIAICAGLGFVLIVGAVAFAATGTTLDPPKVVAGSQKGLFRITGSGKITLEEADVMEYLGATFYITDTKTKQDITGFINPVAQPAVGKVVDWTGTSREIVAGTYDVTGAIWYINKNGEIKQSAPKLKIQVP